MQKQRATATAPFNVLLPHKPPSAAIIDKRTDPANDMPRDMTHRYMQHQFLKRIHLMNAEVSSGRSTTQQCYKRDLDKDVRRDPTF